MHYDDSGLMILTRRFSVTVGANTTANWSWTWFSELGVQFTSYPGFSINGMANNSGYWRIGTEGVDTQKAAGFFFNDLSTSITVWITITAIGTKA